jgi:CRISPR/Cas system CMR-associated protein Cmr5 small subunit
MSIEDKKAMTIMNESLGVVENHYQLDLPLRKRRSFPNNKSQAERRLNSLKTRLKKDADLGQKYKL